MNQCFCRSLAAAVVMSAISAPVSVNAEQVNQLEDALQATEDAETAFDSSADVPEPQPLVNLNPQFAKNPSIEFSKKPAKAHSDALPVAPSETLSPEVFESQPALSSLPAHQATPSFEVVESPESDSSSLVRVIPHALDANQAATLYVNSIPVLTFVGPELDTLADKDSAVAVAESSVRVDDPAARAIAAANYLEAFHYEAGNPESIGVRWDADLEEYAIDIAETTLVAINETVILPDTTDDFAEDALQATNRLRRLLGGAAPLTEIEGQPEPEPEVATGSTWDVTSMFTGEASWYGPGFHGRRTASGEVFNQEALTAAHRTLPFGTLVRVTNLNNESQVVVRINDRGPFTGGRILDLSAAAAREIGLQHTGVGQIRLEVLSE